MTEKVERRSRSGERRSRSKPLRKRRRRKRRNGTKFMWPKLNVQFNIIGVSRSRILLGLTALFVVLRPFAPPMDTAGSPAAANEICGRLDFQRTLDWWDYSPDKLDRRLWMSLGNGRCKWAEPDKVNPEDATIRSLIVGYPGSGKRTAWMEMEGLTGLATGDDYDLSGNDISVAFMKTSFPHHEGIWSWGDNFQQTMLLVRNPRHAMVAYHELLYEIDYSTDWETSYSKKHKVYTLRPPVSDWEYFRDERFDEEMHWWAWYIDFWMEGGVYRDILTHQLADFSWWERIVMPHGVKYPDLETFIPPASPTRHYHCVLDIDECTPVAVLSYENLKDPTKGPLEAEKFSSKLQGKEGISLIEEEARLCVWRELFVNYKGYRTDDNRKKYSGPTEGEYIYTLPQLEKMKSVMEYTRDKYQGSTWASNQLAQDLVGYVEGYILDIQKEIQSLQSGATS